MKYKFVYDNGFIEGQLLDLSEEEFGFCIATVLGNHNAMFFGYKPERLIKAIKKLVSIKEKYVIADLESTKHDDIGFFTSAFSNKVGKGAVIVPEINSRSELFYDTIRLASDNEDRDCQIIVYDTQAPRQNSHNFKEALENFDIIYECKEHPSADKTVTNLRNNYKDAYEYKIQLLSGKFVTGKFMTIDPYWCTIDAYNKYGGMKGLKYVNRKIMKVARSISDIRHRSLTSLSDIGSAIKLYYGGDYQ